MSELIDIFDGNYQHIGAFERVAAHQQCLWHHTFHCWVVADRPSQGAVLFQLRSPAKRSHPDLLDITAAGHLQSGETALDGLRELEEELGVRASSDNLVPLGIKHDVMDEPSGVRNREFAHVYFLRDDRPIEQYRLDEAEVAGLVEVGISDGLALFSGETTSVQARAVRVLSGAQTSFQRDVKVSDMIPRVDQYYLRVFIMAELLLQGHRYLSV